MPVSPLQQDPELLAHRACEGMGQTPAAEGPGQV